ncbi:importin-beta N-terminal domain-containing protein [Besnoitia besnoiti]|uniref:Importin-beta N-terminal domain-containing protein n=1 Tax=Besnoitia besnoiti TaxID=94643 RepID=A0A2A9MIY3_BESBE|nr:importin-beta N-terminal domain-containing protein [Besnoitia besnoiti]PFH35350.1 importin-beta N-terminal domain-containing protein [Besnoitia besnoiti]
MMDDAAQVQQLELLCQAFYGGGSKSEQNEAHQVLLPLASNPANVPRLQVILAKSNNLQALLFATAGLTNLFTKYWSQIPEQLKQDTRHFVLNYLYQRGPDLLHNAPEILGHFVRLLCRIVRLSWLESVSNQKIVEQVNQFLTASTAHWVVGLSIYTELTQEMQPQMGRQMARLRRTAFSFRDTALLDIFKVGAQTLQQFHSGAIRVPNQQEETQLLKQVLQLTHNCLSFDFLGTVPDDATDEQTTVMLPQSWTMLKDEAFPKTLFDLYELCWTSRDGLLASATAAGGPGATADGAGPMGDDAIGGMASGGAARQPLFNPPQLRIDCAQLCLSSLVLVAALRRSFFSRDQERADCLSQLILGTSKIIDKSLGLHNDMCYHEFCRLLGKINAANQLSELCTSKAFADWTAKLFQFTMNSLEDWRRLPNSKHYLLGVWAHMVSPLLFFRNTVPRQLDVYIQRITTAFILSRMQLAEAMASQPDDMDLENPLHNEVLRAEQLDVLTQLGRCRYGDTATKVLELFHETRAAAEQKAISREVFQEKITWLVYIVGALIGGHWTGRVPMTSADDETQGPSHVVNAELAKLVFKLIDETNKFADTPESLELSYLYFLEQFRKVYIGEHAKQVVNIQSPDRFAAVLGAANDDEVLGLLVTKIGFNLQQRADMEDVIKRTLALFHELASGMNIVHCTDRSPHLIISGRLLLSNPTANYLLQHHRNEEFKFLHVRGYGKYRTTYYFTLAKLLFLRIGSSGSRGTAAEQFEAFMAPMSTVFDQLWQQTADGTNVQALANPQCRAPLIGLVRDLRGICMACNTTESYSTLFAWLVNHPKQPGKSRIHLFTWAAGIWWEDSEVIIPLLKFTSEFVHNRSQRIAFDQASANGILLFKEVSSILVSYGKRILEKHDFRDLYKEKYKALAVALEMFSHALNGNYVNFGVFDVYGDGTLNDSLKLSLSMCLAIPDEDLQSYIRSLKPYYSFLDLATKNFMPQVLELSPPMLAQLVRAVEEGLCSFEPGVAMQCCSTIDNIVTFFYQKLNSREPEGQAVRIFLESQPQSLKRVLQLMFQLVITGEFTSVWSMSRPLLGLILLHEQEFLSIKQQLLEQQSKDRKLKLEGFFAELMTDVDSTLENKNKDQFTRNLYQFSSHVRQSLA